MELLGDREVEVSNVRNLETNTNRNKEEEEARYQAELRNKEQEEEKELKDEEIVDAAKRMKMGKAAGVDGIPMEAWRFGGEEPVDRAD